MMNLLIKKFKGFLLVLSASFLLTVPISIVMKPNTAHAASCGFEAVKATSFISSVRSKLNKVFEFSKDFGLSIKNLIGLDLPKVEIGTAASGLANDIFFGPQFSILGYQNEFAVKETQERKNMISEKTQEAQFTALECQTATAHSSLPQSSQIQEEIKEMATFKSATERRKLSNSPASQIAKDIEMVALTIPSDADAGAGEALQKSFNSGNKIPEEVTRYAQQYMSGLTAPSNIGGNPFYDNSSNPPNTPDKYENNPDAFAEIYDFQCRMVFGGINTDRPAIPASALDTTSGREAMLRNTVKDIRNLQLWSFCNGYLKKNKTPTIANGQWVRSILRNSTGISEEQARLIKEAEEQSGDVKPLHSDVMNAIDGLNIDQKGKDHLKFIQKNYPNILSQDQFMDAIINTRFKGSGWFTNQIGSEASTARTHNQLFAQSLMQQRHTHKLLEFLTQFLMMDVAMDLEGGRP
jgi:hypothetical protein